jgi:hypothetical protein
MNMPVRAKHYTGITGDTELFVYIDHALLILLQSPGNTAIHTGRIRAVLASVEPGSILVIHQISPGSGSPSLVSFQYAVIVAIMPGSTVYTAQAATQTVFS